MTQEKFDIKSINQGILNLHNLGVDEKKIFLKNVKDYAEKHDDPLLLELVEEIMSPSNKISKNMKVLGIDKSNLMPVIVDKTDNNTINDYNVEKNSISGLQLLTKKQK